MPTEAVAATRERTAPVIGVVNAAESDGVLPIRPMGVPPVTDAETIAELRTLAERLMSQRSSLVTENQQLRRIIDGNERVIAHLSERLGDGYSEYPLAEAIQFERCGELGRLLMGLRRGHRVFVRLNNEAPDEQPTAIIVGVRVPMTQEGGR